jgi:hypothetical protein
MQKTVHRIIVLGPLRSGTSLTAELVRLWGAYAGREDELWRSNPDDRRGYGYMEYIPLQELNDELLDNNDRVPPPVEWMAEKASDPKYKSQAVHLLQAMDERALAGGAPAWVWKDARLPLTLPFWVNFWYDPIYVVTVRHPAETILSAARTEGVEEENLPFSAGLIYWQYCMLNILAFTRSSRRKFFIAYDQLTGDPRRECTRLAHFLDGQCGTFLADAQRRIETMMPQVSEGQRHFSREESLAEIGQASREQRALYDFLRVKTLYPDEAFHADDFALYPGWREYLQAMDALLSLTRTTQAT